MALFRTQTLQVSMKSLYLAANKIALQNKHFKRLFKSATFLTSLSKAVKLKTM